MNVKVELKNGYFKSNLCLKDRLIDTAYKEFDTCRNINFYCNSCGIYAKDGRTKSFD